MDFQKLLRQHQNVVKDYSINEHHLLESFTAHHLAEIMRGGDWRQEVWSGRIGITVAEQSQEAGVLLCEFSQAGVLQDIVAKAGDALLQRRCCGRE